MGHKAHIIIDLNGSIETNGEKQELKFDCDSMITVEHIDYIIRDLATIIAKAANKVANDGIDLSNRMGETAAAKPAVA